jgi:phage shock protein C
LRGLDEDHGPCLPAGFSQMIAVMSQNFSTPPTPVRPPGTRELRRTRQDRVFGGVCGGLGRYFGIDPVLLRIVAVVLALSGGFGFLAYLIAWIAIPESTDPTDPPARNSAGAPPASVFVGLAFVIVGVLLLMRSFLPHIEFDFIGPAIVVVIGLAIVTSARRPR